MSRQDQLTVRASGAFAARRRAVICALALCSGACTSGDPDIGVASYGGAGGATASAGGSVTTQGGQGGHGGSARSGPPAGGASAGAAPSALEDARAPSDAAPLADASHDARRGTTAVDSGASRDASVAVDASVSRDGSIDVASVADAAPDACSPSVVLVPWRWSQAGVLLPDGAVHLPKELCGMWLLRSGALRVWLSQEGGATLELAVDCADGKLTLGPVPPGDYEVAMLYDDQCVGLGAGAIPVDSVFSNPPCGPLCEPIPLTVTPCGESRVEFEVDCVSVECDDACGW